MAEAPNRRKSPRVSVAETLDAEYANSFAIELLDLSASGARFRAPRDIPVNSALRITINFYPVEFPIRGLVAWSRKVDEETYEHGCEFVNLDPEEQYLIKNYVNEVLREQK